MTENQEPPPQKHITVDQRLFPYDRYREDRAEKMNTLGLAILASLIACSINFTHHNSQTNGPSHDTQTGNTRLKISPDSRLIKLREAA
jgi:hypothetical protein